MLAVYVFGIVVDELMKELIALFCVVESIVSAPPTLDRPSPSRLLNDEPLTTKLVVLAVINEAYVVVEYVNVCGRDQLFAVVVPNARVIVFEESISG